MNNTSNKNSKEILKKVQRESDKKDISNNEKQIMTEKSQRWLHHSLKTSYIEFQKINGKMTQKKLI